MHRLFNNPAAAPVGWYWLLRSRDVRRKRVVAAEIFGHSLAVYRGEDRRVAALDAHCPHMGAHLAEGRVEGNELRCFFHNWRFNSSGYCSDMPALGGVPPFPVCTKSWAVAEKYGLIWFWNGDTPPGPLPFVPELGEGEVASALGNQFRKECHPHVVLINAIDEHHFNSVHSLPVKLHMATREISEKRIEFSNTTTVRSGTLLKRLYRGPLTYSMCYWNAATGTVTLGPDRLHFHIMFALRPDAGGGTEGQTVLITQKRNRLVDAVLLGLTRLVGAYFARGDTRIFRSIRFQLRTPTEADHAIIDFIDHTERQREGILPARPARRDVEVTT
jgi:phenylpropionate dioxygenase-like ring-hydroxylating dioxygenase large terminal subunit